MRLPKIDVAKHASECVKRLVRCDHCTVDFFYDVIDKHHDVCGLCPVACPNGCNTTVITSASDSKTEDKSKGVMLRRDLASHLSDTCPLRRNACPYVRYGCTKGQLSPEALTVHVAADVAQHLALFEFKFASFERLFAHPVKKKKRHSGSYDFAKASPQWLKNIKQGDFIDCIDTTYKIWFIAEVLSSGKPHPDDLLIHHVGWPDKLNEYIKRRVDNVAPLKTHGLT